MVKQHETMGVPEAYIIEELNKLKQGLETNIPAYDIYYDLNDLPLKNTPIDKTEYKSEVITIEL